MPRAHAAHQLQLTDRGLGHKHRWAVACTCGWHGVHRRTRGDAAAEYRNHVEAARAHARAQARTGRRRTRELPRLPGLRPVTDPALLPEVLR